MSDDFNSTSAPTNGYVCVQCGQMRWAGLVHSCPTGLPTTVHLTGSSAFVVTVAQLQSELASANQRIAVLESQLSCAAAQEQEAVEEQKEKANQRIAELTAQLEAAAFCEAHYPDVAMPNSECPCCLAVQLRKVLENIGTVAETGGMRGPFFVLGEIQRQIKEALK